MAAIYHQEIPVDLAGASRERPLPIQFFRGDNDSHIFTAWVGDTGNPQAGLLAGTVAGTALRPDGVTVPLAGEKGSSTVDVTFDGITVQATPCRVTVPQAAFTVPGMLKVSIVFSDGTTTTTVLCLSGSVVQSNTDAVTDPDELIPNLPALQTAAAQALAAAADAETAAESVPALVAPTFDTTTAYAAGDYVYYNGSIYRFTAAHAAGAWTGSDAVAVTVTGEFSDLKSHKISKPTTSPDGALGMVLQSNGDGTTEWVSLAGLNPALRADDLLQYVDVTWSTENEHRHASKNNDGSYSVWVDENTVFNLIFHNSESTIPDWIIPGCTYRVKYSAELIDGDVFKSFALRVYVFLDGNTSSSTRIFIDVKDGTFKIPANTTGIVFRVQKDAGVEISCTVKPELYLLNVESTEIKDYDTDMEAVPSNVVQWQDFTQVGSEIWMIASSSDNHSTANGYIYRIDKESFAYIGSIAHNLGHCNGIDYDQAHDALLVASGQPNDSHIYIYKNVSDWSSESTVDFNTVDKIDINISSVGGISYACACWGEKKQNGFRYVYIANDLGLGWIKIDLAIADNYYTSNFSVVWKKSCMPGVVSGINTSQILQGMVMHKGKIYASLSHNPVFGAAYTVKGNEVVREIIHVDGTGYSSTNEGCTVVDGELLLGVSSDKVIARIEL